MKKVLFILLNFYFCFLMGNDFLAENDFNDLKSGYIVYSNNDTLFGNLQIMKGAHKSNVFIETQSEGNKKVYIEKLRLIVYGTESYKIFLIDSNKGEQLYYAKITDTIQPVKLYPSYTWIEKEGASSGSPIFNAGPIKTVLKYAYLIQIKNNEPTAIPKKNNPSGEMNSYKKTLLQVFSKNKLVTTFLQTKSNISFEEIPEMIALINSLYK